MPYGLPKDIGGDSKENEEWMKNCIADITKKGTSKNTAILICKKTLIKSRRNKKDESN